MRLISMTRLSFYVLAVLLLAMPCAAAQSFPPGTHGIGDGYGPDRDSTYPQEVQTTNSPAGLAVEPGSQLIYLLDTGLDATGTRTDAGLSVACSPTDTVRDCFGPTVGPQFTNFISITNTNPTDAVTVHFRYFNEDCTDILDFLVVLTCNDTMLINPFDYTIPGSTTNVSQRFFGVGNVFPEPIPAPAFGTGRFLLFVQASGAVGNDSGEGNDTSPAGDRGDFDDPEDLDKFADWLFPGRLVTENLFDECWAVDEDTIGIVSAGGSSVNDNNLNVFNASAISFNYLTGFHTVAAIRPEGLAAYGVTAWTRPAVNLSFNFLDAEDTSEVPDQDPDFSPQDVVGPVPTPMTWDPPKGPDGVFDFFDLYNILDAGLDGDGPLAPKRCVLAGSEEIWLTLQRNAALVLPANYFYLRQDAHGGNSLETNCEGFTPDSLRCDDDNPFFQTPVNGGALAWTIFTDPKILPPNDEFLYGLSVKDDYNGSGNPNNFALSLADDSAYRMDAACTYYELAIYDNDEVLCEIPQEIEDISPLPPFSPIITRVALCCITYYTFENQVIPGSQLVPGGSPTDFVLTRNLGTFSVQDLLDLAPPTVGNCLGPVPVNDELGPGWVRFNRIVTRDFWYDATGSSVLGFQEPYDGERGTYVTIAKQVIFQSAFGVSWYLPQAATEFAPQT